MTNLSTTSADPDGIAMLKVIRPTFSLEEGPSAIIVILVVNLVEIKG